jgi:SAM-dependent methyltransferase
MAPRVDPTERFSDRVADYVRYRPAYPPELLDVLRGEVGLDPVHTIVDVGSGTGILSRPLLEHGNAVYGVEPNAAMRQAAESSLRRFDRFCSVDGRAEATGLDAASVDLIVAGQAFHWFSVAETSLEFRRILKPGGWVVLVWNSRRTAGTPFLESLEAFIDAWGTDYASVRWRYDVEDSLDVLFGPAGYAATTLANGQQLDLEGLRGRVGSSSYMPAEADPRREAMVEALQELFVAHAQGGEVRIDYDTEVYFGRLG